MPRKPATEHKTNLANAKVLCVEEDLEDDADIYADLKRFELVEDCSDLKNGDVLILYTHGQYNTALKATNRISWNRKWVQAADAALNLIGAGLRNLKNITLVVHACFSAGTRENPPADEGEGLNTFAGQLCSALARKNRGIKVIGLVGKSKSGRAGFKTNAGDEPVLTRRAKAATVDKHTMDQWEVVYQANKHGEVQIIKMGPSANKRMTWYGGDQ
jgi:hypothetical protein